MSKVVSMIKAVDTGRRSLIKQEPLNKLIMIKEDVYQDDTFDDNLHYRIEVKLGADVVVPVGDTVQLEYAIDVTKESVVEYMFGEFRPYFRELSMALWKEDVADARKILKRFERQMFEEDSFE